MNGSAFLVESNRQKHRNAPCLAERERYLAYLLEIGTRRERVRNVAAMLLHVVRVLKLDSPRPVGLDEIVMGSKLWIDDSEPHRHRQHPYSFQLVATNWFRFQGLLLTVAQPAPPFGNVLSDFLNAMSLQRGLALETLKSYRSRIAAFLSWLQSRCPEFSNVRALDIEEYIEAKRSTGWSYSSVAAHCKALRTFFGYAETQRWCCNGIRESIASPRVPRIAENLCGPSWEDVRRVIASFGNQKIYDLRAKAMFLLFSIYGFRSAEVRGLMLEDIDWHGGTITVRRVKRGKTQQFPLQNEVGEAIALYLENARPKCPCRNLFVTLSPPYRPVLGHSMSTIIGPRMKALGIATDQFGPHTLRRACATQLLRTGSSLKEIAEFLGHNSLRSVSTYAKYDPACLSRVAKFSLRGVL
jgi:site-specific recombinase XerD